MNNKWISSIQLLLLFVLTACVGSIEDASKQKSNSIIQKAVELNFEGVSQAVAVSNSKIQVAFKPATGGSGNYSYLIYLNGKMDTPAASIDSSTALIDVNEQVQALVPELATGTNYTVMIKAYDLTYDVTDGNTTTLNVQTLSEELPNFNGVKAVSNVAGDAGKTSLQVNWTKASSGLVSTGPSGNDEHDISGYNIYYGTSPTALDNVIPVALAETQSYIINGLIEGTTYYVRVRAKDSATPNNNEDLNTVYLSQKTLTDKPIVFSGIKSVEIPKDRTGYHNIKVNWNAGSGNFNSYKIYVSTTVEAFNGVPSSWNSADFESITKISDTTINSKSVYVNNSNTLYYAAVVACALVGSNDCNNYAGFGVTKNITTTPPVVPFGGIKDIGGIEPAPGLDGLTDLNFYWDNPDTTLGVFKRIEIYACDDTSYATPLSNVSVNGVYSLNSSVRVTGLVTGKQYCFVALAVEDGDSPLRKSTIRTLRYATPDFVPPVLDTLSACTVASSKGFKANWNQASGSMLSNYEVFIKKKVAGDNFDWTNAIKSTYHATNTTDFSVNSNKYLVNYLADDTYNYTFTALDPATTYQLGIRTYLKFNSIEYRSNPGLILECTTASISAIHNGWMDIFAIGAKYDALDKTFVKERLANPDYTKEPNSHILYKHRFPVEDSTITVGTNGSDQGIVRLNWYDFKLSNGDTMYDVVNGANKIANSGYKVYRKAHSRLYANSTPSRYESVESDSSWELVSGANLILPQKTTLYNGELTSFGEFVDYKLTRSSNPNEGKIYYYRVEAYVNDVHLTFAPDASQTATEDFILRVVVPPKNMTMMHRWMANKQMCEELGKTIDRNNNYRCLYNGLASVKDVNDEKYYYDMKGDTFIDRFKLGCPFSRGDTTYTCSDVNPTTPTYTYFEGRASSVDTAKNQKAGDCLGSSNTDPTGKIQAKTGAIFLDRASNTCYINTSGDSFGSQVIGSAWSKLETIDSINTSSTLGIAIEYNQSSSPRQLRDKANTRILPYSTTSLLGKGWGSAIYSNDAGLLPLLGTPNSLNWTCQSANFSINNKTYNKRLLRRKEQIAAWAMSPFLDSVDSSDNQNPKRSVEAKIALGEIQNGFSDSSMTSTSKDRDCGTNLSPRKTAVVSSGQMDFRARSFANNKWGSRIYGNSVTWFSLGSGSSGAISTDACVTRFGVQDYVGAGDLALSDTIYCKKSSKFCSMSTKDDQATLFTPPWDEDNRETWRNANNYVHFANSSSTYTNRIGVPLLYKEDDQTIISGGNYTAYARPGSADLATIAIDTTPLGKTLTTDYYPGKISSTGMKNFSLALGVPLICEGTGCSYNGANGDDATFSLQPLGADSLASIQLPASYQESFMFFNNPIAGPIDSSSHNDEFIMHLNVGYSGPYHGGVQDWDIKKTGKYRRFSARLYDGNTWDNAFCAQLIESY